MTEQNINELTKQEFEHYKELKKERTKYFIRNCIWWGPIFGIELTYMYEKLTTEDPQMKDTNIIFAGLMDIIFVGTAINCALHYIDDNNIYKEMKTLEQKMTTEQKEKK